MLLQCSQQSCLVSLLNAIALYGPRATSIASCVVAGAPIAAAARGSPPIRRTILKADPAVSARLTRLTHLSPARCGH